MLFLLLLGASMMDAAAYKGQKAYKMRCKVCHDSGNKMALVHTKKEWEKLFAQKGETLAHHHVHSPKVEMMLEKFHAQGVALKITPEKVDAYFENRTGGESYESSVRHLRDFFLEYARDSDSVPACN
ncbi:MAG: hypothetical protein KU37_00185 [Sulfuricurvum sp. PC08-66]|nr:MAG: hypothetical protein KU37_00185 [Sulfuricurvum sp. PC08-66]